MARYISWRQSSSRRGRETPAWKVDYKIGENGLIELSRMTLGPEDLVNRLIEGTKWAADADI
jgi:hypothetical protein